MIKLTRFASFPDRTIGRFKYGNQVYWSVERPWKDNTPYISCIPDGDYSLVRVDSPKFGGRMWEIADVPDRTHILVHVGNTSADVVGCIALGRTLYSDLSGVGPSRAAIAQFYRSTERLTSMKIQIRTEVLR